MEKKFTHIDKAGNPTMVDVGDKRVTTRIAKARAIVVLPEEVVKLLKDKDIQTKKGPVFQTAILAGIMAAKKTADLIINNHKSFDTALSIITTFLKGKV